MKYEKIINNFYKKILKKIILSIITINNQI